MIEKPGTYTIKVDLYSQFYRLTSNKLEIQVAEPVKVLTESEEELSKKYFDIETASMLSIHGSRNLDDPGMDVLDEICNTFPDSNAALHAQVAMAIPMAHHFKQYSKKNKKIDNSGAPLYYDAYRRLYEVLVIRKADSLFSFGPDYYGKLEKLMHEIEDKIRNKSQVDHD